MLDIKLKEKTRTCDGITRRSMLRLGAIGFGGFTLADLLRAEASAGTGSSHKAVINIHMGGGPSHQDIFDLKPNAPVEYRGEFNPIPTNVPGMQICEHLPKLATMADKFVAIRSLYGSNAGHSDFQTQTGFNQKSMANQGGRPSIGAVASRLQGAGQGGAPAWVAYGRSPTGYLGPVYSPYDANRTRSLTLSSGMTAARLNDRTNLLSELDNMRRELDSSGNMGALDSYTQTAYDMVVSGRVAKAIDLKQEDPSVVERYGKYNGNLLTARRLIQAGVRVITMSAGWGGWDTHGDNFNKLRQNLPKMDQGLSALLWDLERHGMLDDVSVVAWGEFGRTPRVDNDAGRNHWPRVSMAFMAGGGIQAGQMVGATDRIAGEAKDRPVHFQEVHATLYRNLGIDPVNTTIIDSAGRPQYLLEMREPIQELV